MASQSFGVSAAQVDAAMQGKDAVNTFLAGSPPNRLLFYYQSREVRDCESFTVLCFPSHSTRWRATSVEMGVEVTHGAGIIWSRRSGPGAQVPALTLVGRGSASALSCGGYIAF